MRRALIISATLFAFSSPAFAVDPKPGPTTAPAPTQPIEPTVAPNPNAPADGDLKQKQLPGKVIKKTPIKKPVTAPGPAGPEGPAKTN